VSRPVVPAERVGDGARGWNIDCGRLSSWWRLVRRNLSGFGWERFAAGVGGRLGTLLGPEGTAVKVVRSGSLRVASSPVGGGAAGVAAGWYRSIDR
jgi:hypothetical protein